MNNIKLAENQGRQRKKTIIKNNSFTDQNKDEKHNKKNVKFTSQVERQAVKMQQKQQVIKSKKKLNTFKKNSNPDFLKVLKGQKLPRNKSRNSSRTNSNISLEKKKFINQRQISKTIVIKEDSMFDTAKKSLKILWQTSDDKIQSHPQIKIQVMTVKFKQFVK